VRVDFDVLPGEPAYAIRFHETNVVTFYPDHALELNTGGWRTRSTADRMNMAEQVSVFGHFSRRGEYEDALFAKIGKGWQTPLDTCVTVHDGLTLTCDGGYEWANATQTYGEWQDDYQEQRRERARERRSEQHAKALDVIVGNPRGRWGWYEVRAGRVRVENGVIFNGQHPVAVCYPHPEQGVQANVLTVSQRALKRTRVGLELVEHAAANGCKLVFEPHGVVIEEAQNRATKL
jgi:hypothetical protein